MTDGFGEGRPDILRPHEGYTRKYFNLPLPRVVSWTKELDRQQDHADMQRIYYPVLEELIPNLPEIYKAFNGFRIDEARETAAREWLGLADGRYREAIEHRLREIIFRESDRDRRVVVMWIPMVEEDHPVLGTHQKVLVQRALTIPFLEKWKPLER